MINLLPDQTKREIKAARMNVALLRYNFFTLGAIGILALFCLMFYLILNSSHRDALSTSSDNAQKAATYDSVRKKADEYRSNLALASQIIDRGVKYTDVIIEITKLIPKGVTMDSLSLTATSFGQQTSFTAHAKGYEEATQLKSNFQSSKVFTNVFFQSLTLQNDQSSPGYPISISLSAKLNKLEAQ